VPKKIEDMIAAGDRAAGRGARGRRGDEEKARAPAPRPVYTTL